MLWRANCIHADKHFSPVAPIIIIILDFQSSKDQRLVYSGKLLLDHFTLKDVLRKVGSLFLRRHIQ